MTTENEEQPAEKEEKLWFGQEEEKEEMKPWEQHSAVICIPRYDYKAPSSFLDRSLSGFLITCPIKREKSATKEAIPILEKLVTSICSNGSAMLESSGASSGAKKRKVCSEEMDAENGQSVERNGGGNASDISDEVGEETRLPCSEAAEHVKSSLNLSLVKLTRSGLLLFAFPNNNFRQVVGVLSTLLATLESGNVKRPLVSEVYLLPDSSTKAISSGAGIFYFILFFYLCCKLCETKCNKLVDSTLAVSHLGHRLLLYL